MAEERLDRKTVLGWIEAEFGEDWMRRHDFLVRGFVRFVFRGYELGMVAGAAGRISPVPEAQAEPADARAPARCEVCDKPAGIFGTFFGWVSPACSQRCVERMTALARTMAIMCQDCRDHVPVRDYVLHVSMNHARTANCVSDERVARQAVRATLRAIHPHAKEE